MSTSENEKEDEKEENKKKANSAQYGAKCLGMIVNLPYRRVKLFGHNTAYDSYLDFITQAKKSIPIRDLRKAFPQQKEFATHEMILTPNLICYLAMKRLRKMLKLDDFPNIEKVEDPPMKIKTKSDKELIKQNPENNKVFHPQSRENIPSELQGFIHTILTEIDIREKLKSI